MRLYNDKYLWRFRKMLFHLYWEFNIRLDSFTHSFLTRFRSTLLYFQPLIFLIILQFFGIFPGFETEIPEVGIIEKIANFSRKFAPGKLREGPTTTYSRQNLGKATKNFKPNIIQIFFFGNIFSIIDMLTIRTCSPALVLYYFYRRTLSRIYVTESSDDLFNLERKLQGYCKLNIWIYDDFTIGQSFATACGFNITNNAQRAQIIRLEKTQKVVYNKVIITWSI